MLMYSILLSFVSSALLVLNFPPYDLEYAAWVALVPLLLAVRGKSGRAAFGIFFLSAMGFLMGVFYWINVVQGVRPTDFVLLGFYLAPYYGMVGLLLNAVGTTLGLPSILAAPVFWVAMEYLRSHAGFLALPWALLGHSQYENLPAIQIASIFGAYGVSFLVVMVNAAICETLCFFWRGREAGPFAGKKLLKELGIVLTFTLGTIGYGIGVTSKPVEAKTFTVGVVQGNIPQDVKWDLKYRDGIIAKHVDLSRRAAADGHPALIVWPETSLPGTLTHDAQLRETVSGLAKSSGTALIIGNSARPKSGSTAKQNTKQYYNSVTLVSSSGRGAGGYNKIRLLPFAEYLPYRGVFPWPSRFAAGAGNFLPGKEYKVFQVEGARFAVTICWENIFPELVRAFVKRGAQFIVNITNEAWFGETAAPRQFLAMSVFRAVENRVPVVRSANTGISCIITPTGEIIGRVQEGVKDLFVEGYLTGKIPLSEGKTFYTVHGDVFAISALVYSVCSVGAYVLKRFQRRVPS